MRQVLTGHDSPETAYIIASYPYSYRLRTKKRMWVETRTTKGFIGQRLCEQTLNPKTGAWNKAHKGTYDAIVLLYKDITTGHVKHDILKFEATEKELNEFIEQYDPSAFADRYRANMVRFLREIIDKESQA